MPEITHKRRGELLRKVFEILAQHTDGLPAKEVLQRAEQSLALTDFEKSEYPNRPGVRRFEKIVRFSTITVVKAGWLIKSKGRWALTDTGVKAYQKFQDPERFSQEAARLYREWKETQPEVEEIEEDSPDAASTLEEAEENAWTEIQEYLQEMNPYDFQNLVAALLKAMGYYVTWVAPPGRDAGVDVVAYTDPIGTKPPRIKVQVKRRAEKIGVDGLRSFMAVLGDEDVGIFVSTGGFTSDAEEEARAQEKRKITLIGLEDLFDLWVQHYDKIAEADKQLLPLKPIYFLAPSK